MPPFANTAMDGYAVRAVDTVECARSPSASWAPCGPACPVRTRPVGAGEAVRIMTGAPVPPGADAIVMVELTEGTPDGDTVVVRQAVPVGNHIRPAGDDVVPGDRGARARSGAHARPPRPAGHGRGSGRCPSSAALGSASSPPATSWSTTARRWPRARSVTPTGSPCRSLVAESGFEAVDLGLVRDDEAAIEAALRAGVETCDALVTTGGVSMGDFDFVKVVLDRIGDMRWMQVAIKPAKPLAFGTVTPGRRHARAGLRPAGQPGVVDGELRAVLPARPAPHGRARRHRPRSAHRARRGRRAAAASPGRQDPLRPGHLPLRRASRAPTASGPPAHQGSHHMAAMAAADALAELPDGPTVEVGSTVRVRLLRP